MDERCAEVRGRSAVLNRFRGISPPSSSGCFPVATAATLIFDILPLEETPGVASGTSNGYCSPISCLERSRSLPLSVNVMPSLGCSLVLF